MVAKTNVGFAVAFSIDWNIDADGDWAVASNWSTGVLPAATDDVDIDTVDFHTIAFGSGTATVNSLTVGNDDFVMAGGTLTVANGATFDNGLTIDSGTLRLSGNAFVTGAFNDAGLVSIAAGTLSLAGGGTFSTGSIHIAAGATLHLEDLSGDSAFVLSDGGRFGSENGTIFVDESSLTVTADTTVRGEFDTSAASINIGANRLHFQGAFGSSVGLAFVPLGRSQNFE